MFGYVEMMGLPGAGKTTLARRSLEEARRADRRVFSRSDAVDAAVLRRNDGRIRNFLKKCPAAVWKSATGVHSSFAELHRFASGYPGIFSAVLQVAHARVERERIRECMLHDLFRYAAEYQILSDSLLPNERVLSEEGFAQLLSMVFGYLPDGAVPEGDLRSAVRDLPPIKALIRVNTPVEMCVPRLKQRQALPLVLQDCDNDASLLARLQQADRSFQIIADEFEARGGRVIHVSGSGENVSAELLPELFAE